MKTIPTLATITLTAALAACGGGDDAPAASGGAGNTGGAGFTARCNTAGYVAGSVALPTAAQLAAYAGTYNGDEGSYDTGFNFVKSGGATLVIGSDGRFTYNGVAYEPSSVCIDVATGDYGQLLYLVAGNGHIDVSSIVAPGLGSAWGVSPADGTAIFTNGVK